MGNPRTDWCFTTEPEAQVGNRRINYPRGRVIGGISSINGMIYMRGQSADYDAWRQAGNIGWAGPTFSRISSSPKTISAARASFTAQAANCASNANAFAGTCSTRSAMRPTSAASRRSTTSTGGSTTAPRISRSLKRAAGGGAPPHRRAARHGAFQPERIPPWALVPDRRRRRTACVAANWMARRLTARSAP